MNTKGADGLWVGKEYRTAAFGGVGGANVVGGCSFCQRLISCLCHWVCGVGLQPASVLFLSWTESHGEPTENACQHVEEEIHCAVFFDAKLQWSEKHFGASRRCVGHSMGIARYRTRGCIALLVQIRDGTPHAQAVHAPGPCTSCNEGTPLRDGMHWGCMKGLWERGIRLR